MNQGKCPKCGLIVSHVNIEHVDIRQAFQSKWHGASLVCPNLNCSTVLGVTIDPIAIKADTISGVLQSMNLEVLKREIINGVAQIIIQELRRR